jgi:hypothetical protein
MITMKTWIENIGTFDMEILHKKGKDNIFVYAFHERMKR